MSRRTTGVQLRSSFFCGLLASGLVFACVPKKAAAPAVSSVISPAPPGSAGAPHAPASSVPANPKPAKVETRVYADPPTNHKEALEHQLDARFARRSDRDRQVELPHADHRHWKRVRFGGVDHFTGFIYGEDRHLMTSAFVVKLEPNEQPTTALCMERFEREGLAKFQRHKGKFTPILESSGTWHEQPLLIHRADGRLSVFFSHFEFSAAWAAYPAYEDGCLVYATVVFWDGEKELAQRVRDHWVEAAFSGVRTRSTLAPTRK